MNQHEDETIAETIESCYWKSIMYRVTPYIYPLQLGVDNSVWGIDTLHEFGRAR